MKVPKRKKRPVSLMLTSMIDMFTILIIYLLSASSGKYAQSLFQIPSQLPALPSADMAQPPPQKNDKPQLQLTVMIEKEGFLVTGQIPLNPTQDVQRVSDISFKVLNVSGNKYDFQKLTEALKSLKPGHEDEQTIVITADAEVNYETLVATMDATREYAEDINGTKTYRALFPQPTIAAGIY